MKIPSDRTLAAAAPGKFHFSPPSPPLPVCMFSRFYYTLHPVGRRAQRETTDRKKPSKNLMDFSAEELLYV